jgi:hypothetical protein
MSNTPAKRRGPPLSAKDPVKTHMRTEYVEPLCRHKGSQYHPLRLTNEREKVTCKVCLSMGGAKDGA